MKDISFFLLKSSLAACMKKGMRTFCSTDASTSTLNQNYKTNRPDSHCISIEPPTMGSPSVVGADKSSPRGSTLEEMILQLELEEEIARRAKLDAGNGLQRRMSCVNNTDILRCARNALNQYPRFSLDGKDAMYRSSFRNSEFPDRGQLLAGRRSVSCDRDLRGGRPRLHEMFCSEMKHEKPMILPRTLAGERVIWCKPGVVAKLMGIDAMPVPLKTRRASEEKLSFMSSSRRRREVMMRRIEERHEVVERKQKVGMNLNNCDGICRMIKAGGSCSNNKSEYCVMKPVMEEPVNVHSGVFTADRPTRRYS